MARILAVDDDPHIREVVRFALESAGHLVDSAENGKDALRIAAERAPDLVVLDIVMPGMDGIELCQRIRAASTVPVLFLSAKDDEIDRVIGLEVGGDDYVTKPFGTRELVSRVKAMLRRVAMAKSSPAATRSERLVVGELTLSAEQFSVIWRGRSLVLTVTEFGILETLMRHPAKVYTRSELVELAYRFDNHVTERTIDTHTRRIRKKFGEDGEPIETVYGLGYRLGSCGRPG
ncbi:MAG: response regulator transcription factor [Deltaproteobacteria bacterium]|nr:response regulator transcription factor [Deltaproteobacteria bacterium]